MRLFKNWEIKQIDPLNVALYRVYLSQKEGKEGEEMYALVGYYSSFDALITKLLNMELNSTGLENEDELLLHRTLLKISELYDIAYQYLNKKADDEGLEEDN